MIDNITELYHSINGPKRNFYKLQGFRAGYNGRSKSLELTINDSDLPSETKRVYRIAFEQGKEISREVKEGKIRTKVI